MISIITPTYNRAHLLPKMVNSVINQFFEDWELIIIDDGSNDNTRQIVDEFQENRIRYFYTENTGATDSRNFGVSQARGEYIIFLDSDDEANNNWLEELHIGLKEARVVTCGYDRLNEKGNLTERKLPEKLGNLLQNYVANFLSGTLLIQKDLFNKVGGYDIELTSGQHTELFIRLAKHLKTNNLKIFKVEKSLVKIHIHSGPRVRNNHGAIYSGSMRTMEKHKDLFLKNPKAHFNYLCIAARCAIKTNRVKEGKHLLNKAFWIKPFHPISIARISIGYIPFFRKKFWKAEIK